MNYSYRIYPNQQQEESLLEWLDICRGAYNYALRELKDYLASRKCPIDRCSIEKEYIIPSDSPFPGYHQQQNNLPAAKKKVPRLAKVPSQVLQTTIRRLHDACDFFRARGYGFPRFKKIGQFKSILFPQFNLSPIFGNTIKLPKLGKVVCNFHRPIPEGFKVKQVRVVRKAVGWFAVLSISADVDVPQVGFWGRAVGVDIGLLEYLATSDGFRLPRPKFFKDLESELKLLQKRLSRKKKRSKNYEKARKKIEKLYNHIAFKRKDFQYKLAHKICDLGDSIFVEDLDFRISAKGMFGKQMLDGGFGQFRSILEWVCWQRGKFFAKVDSRGTSKQCPKCEKEWSNDLSIRWHECECGYTNNRDVAAAEVIRNRGLTQARVSRALESRPEGISKYAGTTAERKQPADKSASPGVSPGVSAGRSVLPGQLIGKCYAGKPIREDGKPALYR